MRAKELDSLLGHLRAYDTVRLVAGREFGRTTLLRQLDTALVARGLSVVRISGDPLLAGARYAALREILPAEKLQHQATPSEVRDVLAVEFSRFPNTVVLIDDAECLDLASAQAIAPLLTRSSVAGVCVTPPIEQMTADQRAVAATLRADVRIELRALSFEQVGVLAESLLGGTVEPDIASEVFSMSSGVTGIAADILRTGRTTGQITLRGGRWVLTGRSLWNSHLEETVERLISPLSTSTTTALHALAISGSLPATDLYAHDAQAADTLTRQGLVTTFLDPHGQTRVAPRPALITDYFRHRPVDLLHFAAAATLHTLCPETPGQQEEATDDASVLPRLTSHVQHSDAQDTHNAGLARYLREDAEIQLADSSRRWRRDGDVASAATYLDTLLRSGGYVATAVEVLERTSSDTSDGESLLRLALHEMALMSEATPPASGHVAAIRRDHDEYAPALDAYAAYVAFSATGRDATVDAWLARSGSDPTGLSEAVAAFIRVATGEALPVDVPPHEGQHIPLHRAIIEQTRVLTRARHAARTDTLQELLADPIDLATGDDPFSFLIDSYVRSQLLLTLGQVNEARQTLSNALSVGDLDLTVGSLYAAMLRWSAFLHHREGRSDIARSLLAESREYASLRGPFPGMRPEFGEAIEALLAGDRFASAALFLSEARECAQRVFIDASWSMLRFAFQLDPTEQSLELMRELSRHDAYRWTPRLADFAAAALRQDPAIIVHVAAMTGQPELACAADFLEDIEFALRDRASEPSAEYAEALAEVRQSFAVFQEPLSRVAFRQHTVASEPLTPREREIAPLTATLSNRDIAERLTLSVRTVENHIARAMKKLGVASRTELPGAFMTSGQSTGGHSGRGAQLH